MRPVTATYPRKSPSRQTVAPRCCRRSEPGRSPSAPPFRSPIPVARSTPPFLETAPLLEEPEPRKSQPAPRPVARPWLTAARPSLTRPDSHQGNAKRRPPAVDGTVRANSPALRCAATRSLECTSPRTRRVRHDHGPIRSATVILMRLPAHCDVHYDLVRRAGPTSTPLRALAASGQAALRRHSGTKLASPPVPTSTGEERVLSTDAFRLRKRKKLKGRTRAVRPFCVAP